MEYNLAFPKIQLTELMYLVFITESAVFIYELMLSNIIVSFFGHITVALPLFSYQF